MISIINDKINKMIKTNFTRTQVLELMEYLDNRRDDEMFDTYQEELDYYVAEKQINDINYTHSSTQLKDKVKLTFDKWKFSKGIRYVSGHNYKDNEGDLYDSDELEKMYEHYLNL